jgi:hypothetical protein
MIRSTRTPTTVRSCCRVPHHAVKIRCHQRNPMPQLGHYDAADHLENAASNRDFVAASLGRTG